LETIQGLFFLLHLKQEHEERERFLHHLRTYKYCRVNTVILPLYEIHKTVLNYVAYCYYNVLTVTILLHFVNSVINREVSVIVYVFFAFWSNNLKYCIFLPQIQTQLLALFLHLPHIAVWNVCWRLLNFLNYLRHILLDLFNESTVLSHCSQFTIHQSL